MMTLATGPDNPPPECATRPSMTPLAHSRRRFLKAGLLAAAACMLPPLSAQARTADRAKATRDLRFYNTHTDERLDIRYCADGRYLPEALQSINHIMRDHRTGDIRPIDPRLLDLLHGVWYKAAGDRPLHIISGYRSPRTNAVLRRRSRGVAHHSLHMEGSAADIRIPGLPLRRLHDIAVGLNRGGVGYYPKSGFVHVDIGRVRYW